MTAADQKRLCLQNYWNTIYPTANLLPCFQKRDTCNLTIYDTVPCVFKRTDDPASKQALTIIEELSTNCCNIHRWERKQRPPWRRCCRCHHNRQCRTPPGHFQADGTISHSHMFLWGRSLHTGTCCQSDAWAQFINDSSVDLHRQQVIMPETPGK